MSIAVTREDLNTCTVKLTVTCDAETVKAGFDKAYKQAAKRVRIPGFRPGHAPKHLVAQSVDPQMIYELAADELVRKNWKIAVEQEKLEPFQPPVVDLKKLQQGTEVDKDGNTLEAICEFDVKVPLKPVVELGDYKGLTAERPAIDVTDEEVEQQIEAMRARRGKREAVTGRGAEKGDIAVINIRGEQETGEGKTFMAIVGQTFPALDELLVGMETEDFKSAELEFPNDFQDPEWAGKKIATKVTLRSVSAQQLPELDDEFAKTLNAENVTELRNRVKEVLLRTKQEQVQAYINEQLLDGLVANSKIEVPDTMWEQVANQRLNDIAREQQQLGRKIEDFVAERGMTVEQYVETVRAEAKVFVLRAQAIQEIFVKEEMKIDNEALNQELFLMAQEFGMEPKELAEALQKNDSLQEVYHRAIHRKVMNLLNSSATIKEVGSEDSAKPAKSSAKAKKSDSAKEEKASASEKDSESGEASAKTKKTSKKSSQ
jgi:trigger factor